MYSRTLWFSSCLKISYYVEIANSKIALQLELTNLFSFLFFARKRDSETTLVTDLHFTEAQTLSSSQTNSKLYFEECPLSGSLFVSVPVILILAISNSAAF